MNRVTSPHACNRHDRVWPTAFALASLARDAVDATERAAIELWTARGWPFVVRRCDGDATRIAVGFALPPSFEKRRFGFAVAPSGIAAHAPPLALRDVVARSTGDLRDGLVALAREAERARIALRVFGSVAWQAQTGLDYVRAGSDLDVLIRPASLAQLDATMALLGRAERRLPMRLDGEIVFPGGEAVAWREWAQTQHDDRVLAKHIARVTLVSRRELLRQLPERRLAA